MAWRNYQPQPELNFDDKLVIEHLKNLASNYKLNQSVDSDLTADNPQPPFFYGIRGVPALRGRTTAYKVEK